MKKAFKGSIASLFFRVILATFVLLLFDTCIKEECTINERKLRNVHILPVWESGTKLPEGIRVYFYSLETKKFVQDNLDANGGYTEIRDGLYSLLLYNNDSEKILIRNSSQYETFEAYTNKMDRPSFISPAPEEETFDQPDALWAANIDTLVISDDTKEIPVYPKSVIHRYYGKINVEGIEHALSARGAITNMKSSIKLKDKTTGTGPATLFFNAQMDDDRISFAVKTFGIFHSENSQAGKQKHYLSLEFLLPHGIIQRNIDITDKLNSLPDEGTLLLEEPIIIPPDTTSGNDDGFNANVGDWDETYYPIPL